MTSESQVPAAPGGASAAQKVRVLLVDDQPIIAAAVRRMIEGQLDIEFCYCEDPGRAIATAMEFKPTVILQDLVMPQIDGLTLVRFFRANPATREIPMIVLSSKEEPETKADSFACGANDYLVKLPDKIEVVARLRYHSRGYIALQERNLAYARLASELADAAEYVRSLLPPPREGSPQARWCFVPSMQLGGDSFGYHWVDADHFAIYLLDVCGHGVKAALLSVSVMNVLRSSGLPGVDCCRPAQVLAGLNQAFPMEQHNDMFFTIWYGVYHRPTRELAYASAGHPPALLLEGASAAAGSAYLIGSKGPVIGAMPDVSYAEERRRLGAFARLFVYSDGTYELRRKEDGSMWAFQEWTAMLAEFARAGGRDLDEIRRRLVAIQGAELFEDDLSLLDVTF